MRELHSFPLSPFSRKVRLALAEKRLEVDLIDHAPWERPTDLLKLNPACEVPVLVEANGQRFVDSTAICEYLEEVYPEHRLLPEASVARAEVRRLVSWFDVKFHAEVTENLLIERVYKRMRKQGEPDSGYVRAGVANLRTHLDYMSWIVERRSWLGGDVISLSDFAAASHLSSLDYLGAIPWDEFPHVKTWYAKLKSRPAFRGLLADHLPGLPPAAHYADLDF
jgi:glutathione S-transferase